MNSEVDNMGPAIVWFEHPIIQGVAGIGIGGGIPMTLSSSAGAVEIGAGVGMIGLPVAYWQSRKLYEYIATNPKCQKVINSIAYLM